MAKEAAEYSQCTHRMHRLCTLLLSGCARECDTSLRRLMCAWPLPLGLELLGAVQLHLLAACFSSACCGGCATVTDPVPCAKNVEGTVNVVVEMLDESARNGATFPQLGVASC